MQRLRFGSLGEHPLSIPSHPRGTLSPKPPATILWKGWFPACFISQQSLQVSIAAQAAASRVMLCFEKLKQQQQPSFSRDTETGLQTERLLGRKLAGWSSQDVPTVYLLLPSLPACPALGRNPADIPHPVHEPGSKLC